MADDGFDVVGERPPPPDQAPPPTSAPNGQGSRGFDRVPPHSLEAEVSVLGACMLSNTAAVEVAEILHPEDFYRSAHRVVFEAIRELMERSEPIDPVTVLDHLASTGRLDQVGGAAAVHELVSTTPTAANGAHYARIVHDRALLRRLIEAGTDIVALGYEPTDDPIATVSEAESIMFAVAEQGTTGEATALKDLLNESFMAIEERAERGDDVIGLPTGFNELDAMTAGLQPENLVILAARPAMGKSSLAMSLVHYVTAELHEPAVLFSLEMSKSEIVQRLLASEAMIDSSRLKTGRLEDHDWRKLGEALGKLADAPLFIDDTPAINLMEIMSKCRRLKQRHGLSLVIVDYLQLMQGHRRTDNRQEEVAHISRGLKMLAKELKVPVIALSQLSRQPESRTDKRPMLADLRESGCLTRDMRLFRADTGQPVTFGELLDSGAQDVPVWATDEQGRLVQARLTRAFPSGVKATYRVRLRSGATVDASGNHPFRTLDGWTALDDLSVGSRVATARVLPAPTQPTPMDPDEVVLLAHLIGEGTILRRQPVHYTSADEQNLRAVEEAARRRFGITARRDADGRSAATTQLHLPSPHRLTHGVRNPIAEWLDGLGLWDRRAWQKHIPAEVFGLPDDQLRLFLRHLFATDGSVTVRVPAGRSNPQCRLYYATASLALAQDLRLLLLRLGFRGRLRTIAARDGGRPQHTVDISGVAQQVAFLREVGFHGERGERVAEILPLLEAITPSTNVDTVPREVWTSVREARTERGMTEREFQAQLGNAYCGTTLYKAAPSRERLGRAAAIVEDERLARLASNDLFWDEIEAIEPLGDREVFDATVAGVHNFVCEGLVLHNSIEQDADIVAFIYRDEVYNEDSPDRGIAELIVSKHRNGRTGVVRLAFLGHVTKFANLARGGGGFDGGPPAPPPTEAPPI